MPLLPGTRFGSYEIVAPLGAGGMGEVYRARDTKLHRDVAIKVVAESVAGDPERLTRFAREAQLLAALNHPNIAAIHGVIDEGGITALVLELVEGPTLAERLDGGALPVDEALSLARQIALALEAAHDAGIVHRDLKPSNIKLRLDGTVKVLDFGLAKAYRGSAVSAVDQTHSPTMPDGATAAGLILGTAAYMAPEQARGRPVDKRADIWAFGVVLWEMLAGRPLFLGETLSDTLAAVLTREIDWTQLPPSTPPGVVDLLRRCLEREPRKRLRDIGDARLDTADVIVESAPTAGVRRWWPVALGAAALVTGFLAGRGSGPAAAPVAAPTDAEVRFMFPVDDAQSAAIAPDGSAIVIASSGPLRVRDLRSVSMRDLSGTDGAVKPFWSPDSRTIAYGRAGRLWRVSVMGGTPAAICDLPDGYWDHDAGGAWQPDDSIVFTNGGSALLRVGAAGGDPVVQVAADGPGELHFHGASTLPEGRGVLSVLHRDAGADTLVLAAGTRRTVLLQLPGQIVHDPTYSATGHILFSREPTNEGIWALPFSLDRLEVTGEPYLVEAGGGAPSTARTGALVFLPRVETRLSQLRWLARDGTAGAAVGEPGEFERFPELSPDGTRIAISERFDGGWGISVLDLARETRQRIVGEGRPSTPTWLPDGRSLLYSASAPGNPSPTIRRVSADGSRTDHLGDGFRPFSADGTHVFFERFNVNDFDVFVAPLAKAAHVATFIGGAIVDVSPRPSPDGRLVAYMSMPSLARGRPEVMLRTFPASEARWQVSSGGGSWPRWSRDGTRLHYITADAIFEVGVAMAGDVVTLSPPRRLFTYRTPLTATGPAGFDVAKDGRFLVLETVGGDAERPVNVVLRWTPRHATGR